MGMIKDLVSPGKWKERLLQYRRTIEVSRKPDKEEFTSSSKITGIGMIIIGFIGFVIFMVYHLLISVV